MVLAGLAWVIYQVYLSVIKIQAQAQAQMSHNNVVLTKDGMRVGIKSIGNEAYVDRTQSWLVKAWTLSGETKEAHNRYRRRVPLVESKEREPPSDFCSL